MFGFYGKGAQTMTMWRRQQASQMATAMVNDYRPLQGTQMQIRGGGSTVVVTPQSTAGWGSPLGMTQGTRNALVASAVLPLAPVTVPLAVLSAIKGQKGRCKRLKAKYQKLKIKGASSKKLAKVKKEYTEACKLYALHKAKVHAKHAVKSKVKAQKHAQKVKAKLARHGGSVASASAAVAAETAMTEPVDPTGMPVATAADGSIDDADLDAAVDAAPEGATGGGLMSTISDLPSWVWIAGAAGVALLIFGGLKAKGGGRSGGGSRKASTAAAPAA